MKARLQIFLCATVTGALPSEAILAREAVPDLPDCPAQLAGRGNPSSRPTEPFECYCSVEARRLGGGYAFGSGPYDGISNICMAAMHAGATGPNGGEVRVIPGPILKNFKGSLANGVFSSDWDGPSQFGSFDVESVGAR